MSDPYSAPVATPSSSSRPAARRRAPKAVWWLLGLAVLAALAVWLLSPWWTVARMHRALRDRDAAAFSAYVDYPAVRESLKPVVAARVKAEITQQMDRYGGVAAGLAVNGLVEQIAGAAVAAAVDTAVTPAGLMAMMMGAQARDAAGSAAGAVGTPPSTPPAPAGTGPGAGARPGYAFHGGYAGGANRFGVSLAPPGGGELRFVLTRRGFATWRLTEIVPPAG